MGLNPFFSERMVLNADQKKSAPKKVQQDAEENFRKGFYCCEALICAIRDNFELDVPPQVIAMASGMAVGAGQAGCMCGAFNGGTMALGLFSAARNPVGRRTLNR